MKKISLALIMFIIVGICIPAVSADDHNIGMLPFSDEKNLQVFDYSTVTFSRSSTNEYTNGNAIIGLSKVQFYSNMHYFMWETPTDFSFTEGDYYVWYSRPSDNAYKKATFKVIKTRNMFGQVKKTVAYLFPLEWAVGTKTGAWSSNLYVDNNGVRGGELFTSTSNTPQISYKWSPVYESGNPDYKGYMYITAIRDVSTPSGFSQHSRAEGYTNIRYVIDIEEAGSSYIVELTRIINGIPSPSTIKAIDSDDVVVYEDSASVNREFLVGKDILKTIEIITGTITNTYILNTGDAPTHSEPAVTVYIKNSQTGALIANANIVIDALVNGEYYTVVNRTEPSGIFSITLQPTGGGQPNPDGYRLIATADGYNNPMPEINFTVDDSKKYIYCLLDPIAGGPENENKTFIDFFVRDMSANPISGATVKFGNYTLITNSQGYTVFEVDKNNPYTWIVSKSGYGPLTGNVVIGDAPRHTINTVLAPAVTPTKPTAIPTSTPIKPNPTMTSPTGESVSNWLEWFAAHFGMILGGGVEIGKIFMWLCFTVPVGVYVGKESKSGAAGFMAGAGIVTLFFVLIGWVPVWLLVLLVLIIGLLYAKVFNNADNGGGR